MTSRPVVLAFQVLVASAVRSAGAQPADSLYVLRDNDDIPSESALEDRSGTDRRGGLVWRSGFRDSGEQAGLRHGMRASWISPTVVLLASGDHDSGEDLVASGVPRLMDHVALSAWWRPARSLEVIVGSYRRAFFHGLRAGTERFGSLWSDPEDAARVGSGLRSWAGASEDSYLSGVAATAAARHLRLSFWLSVRHLDAAIDSSSAEPSARWVRGGLHATDLQRSRRDATTHREAGLAAEWQIGPARAGLLVVRELFSLPFCAAACYRPGRFRSALTAASGHFALTMRDGGFSFEIDPTPSGVDLVGGAQMRIRGAGSLRVTVTSLSGYSAPLFSAPPTFRGSDTTGESGALVSWRFRPIRGLAVTAVSGHAILPDGTYTARLFRSEQTLTLDAARSRVSARLVLRRSVRQTPSSSSRERSVVRTVLHRLRFRLRAPVSRHLAVTLLGAASEGREPGVEALGGSVDWEPTRSWRLRAGLLEFADSAADGPLVSWEPETPIGYPLRTLHGDGRRAWFLLEWRSRSFGAGVSCGTGHRLADGPGRPSRRTMNASIALAWTGWDQR